MWQWVNRNNVWNSCSTIFKTRCFSLSKNHSYSKWIFSLKCCISQKMHFLSELLGLGGGECSPIVIEGFFSARLKCVLIFQRHLWLFIISSNCWISPHITWLLNFTSTMYLLGVASLMILTHSINSLKTNVCVLLTEVVNVSWQSLHNI